MDHINTPIEDDLPTEEEQQRLRLERMTVIGKLPMEYGILIVIVAPNTQINVQIEGLAPFEILGALRFVQINVERGIQFQSKQNQDEEEAPTSIM